MILATSSNFSFVSLEFISYNQINSFLKVYCEVVLSYFYLN